jgi:hypothetical protein
LPNFNLAGDILIWNDFIPTQALRDTLDWNFKMVYFLNHEESLSKSLGEEKLGLLVDFIVKVTEFMIYWLPRLRKNKKKN